MRGSGSRKARSIGSCRRRSCDVWCDDLAFLFCSFLWHKKKLRFGWGTVLRGRSLFVFCGGVGLFPGAGMCARRRTYFLLLRQKKVGKEKASPGVCVPLRPFGAKGAACGARSRGGAVELASRTLCAALGHPRRVRSRSRRVLRHACPPRALRSSAQTQGRGAAHGPLLRSAWGARVLRTAHPDVSEGRRWSLAERSDGLPSRRGRAQRRPVPLPSGCAWGAQGAGWRACRRTRPLRELACRGCPNVARQRAVSSTAHPAPEHPRLPRSPRGRTGSQTAGSPFLWLLSFGEAKESDSPAGATSRLRKAN